MSCGISTFRGDSANYPYPASYIMPCRKCPARHLLAGRERDTLALQFLSWPHQKIIGPVSCHERYETPPPFLSWREYESYFASFSIVDRTSPKGAGCRRNGSPARIKCGLGEPAAGFGPRANASGTNPVILRQDARIARGNG